MRMTTEDKLILELLRIQEELKQEKENEQYK